MFTQNLFGLKTNFFALFSSISNHCGCLKIKVYCSCSYFKALTRKSQLDYKILNQFTDILVIT
jgi:hypothetical protein